MEFAKIKVSYRDKESTPPKNVSLGEIDAPRFASVEEALEYLRAEEGDGKEVGVLLDYLHTALDIELQRRHRDAHRPDKPKTTSNLAIFKQLSQAQQEELLKASGHLSV